MRNDDRLTITPLGRKIVNDLALDAKGFEQLKGDLKDLALLYISHSLKGCTPLDIIANLDVEAHDLERAIAWLEKNKYIRVASRSYSPVPYKEVAAAVAHIRNSYAEGRAADHGFDAGEFGDPASYKSEEKEIAELLRTKGWKEEDFEAEERREAYHEVSKHRANRGVHDSISRLND